MQFVAPQALWFLLKIYISKAGHTYPVYFEINRLNHLLEIAEYVNLI